MKEDYLISIIGTQTIEGESEKTEFTTTGTYKVDGKNKYILYKEYNNAAIKDGTLSTLNIYDDRVVSLVRDDAQDASLVIEKGKRHMCNYNTTLGALTLGVYTSKFNSTLGNNGGKLDIEYSLDLNCDISSVNKLQIEVKKIMEDNK